MPSMPKRSDSSSMVKSGAWCIGGTDGPGAAPTKKCTPGMRCRNMLTSSLGGIGGRSRTRSAPSTAVLALRHASTAPASLTTAGTAVGRSVSTLTSNSAATRVHRSCRRSRAVSYWSSVKVRMVPSRVAWRGTTLAAAPARMIPALQAQLTSS